MPSNTSLFVKGFILSGFLLLTCLSASYSQSMGFYQEAPSRAAVIPPEAYKTIIEQHRILQQQGRSIKWHRAAGTSNTNVCGTCRDMGAENGWDVWQAEQGPNYDSLGLQLLPIAAPTLPRFTITTGAGIDPLTPGVNPGDPPITLVAPPGFGTSSIFLGERQNDGAGGGCFNQQSQFAAGCAERLTYCFNVGLLDTNFVYAYAFVMENPGDNTHTLRSMPYVEFMILDANGDTLPCAYQRYIASESFPGQYTCNTPRVGSTGGGGGGGVLRDTALYKPWTIEGVNLSAYIGQTLTVVITNADCQLGGHFAHSYWDFACGSQSAVIKPNCYTNAPDTLVAPASPDTINTYSYEWYLNNNPTPVGYGQVITPYALNGDTFTVKVVTPSGCDWYARYVPQHFTVSTDFTFQTSCGSALFQANSFSPSAEDPISYWSWNFPGGTPSVSDTSFPGPVSFTPGNHTVTLISGTYSPGCRDTMQYVINVPQEPVASFSASDICAGSTVNFNNTSSIPAGDTIASYQWVFPGGNPATSSVRNPIVNFPDPGQSQIMLVVTSTRGCKDTLRRTINVRAQPVASFSLPTSCLGQPVQLTSTSYIASSTDTLSYSWTVPGGLPGVSSQQFPIFNFVVPDTFIATLVVTSTYGCRDTVTGNVIVNPKPYADFTSPRFCAGVAATLSDASIVSAGEQIVAYQWSIPGGSPSTSNSSGPLVSFPVAGTVNATLVITNSFGCKDTAVHPIVISANPTASFNASSVCIGQPFQLQNTSTIQPAGDTVNYQWSIPGGTPNQSAQFEPSVTFSAPVTSSITLIATASGGCSDTVTRTVIIHPLPQANFVSADACFGAPISFFNQSSVVPGDSIISYSWSFPGGSPGLSSGQNPSVVFNLVDTLDVTLVVTNQGGCRDTAIRPLRITPNPTAAFSTTSPCLGIRPSIINSSSIRPVGSPMYYQWAFGGGAPATSNARDPVVDYPAPGSSLISLVVSADGGCADTTERFIQVFPLPLADFSSPQVCYGTPVVMDNNSQLFPGDTMSSYQWVFPNGNPAVSQAIEPLVTFNSTDTSLVRLVATTIHGCRDTVMHPVLVSASPVAQFTVPDVCAGLPSQSVNLSTVQPAGSTVTYSWSAPGSDTPQSTLQQPSLIYASSGSYPIDLIVQAAGGCADTIRRNVSIHPLPDAGFTVSPGCVNQPFQFTNTSSVSSGSLIQSYSWELSGGAPAVSSVRNPSVRYDSSGTFTASLVAVTNNGCRDTTQGPVIVHALPVVSLPDLDSACIPFCHPFSGMASSSDGLLTQWSWSFPGGNPSTSSQQTPGFICYDQPGTYGASLQVTSEYGCSADTQVTGIIQAYALPAADFSISSVANGILNPNYTFTDASSNDVVQWLWNFGDGSPTVLGGPVENHSYAGSMVGNTFYQYETSLIVTTRYGCTDTIRKPIDIVPDFTFYAPTAFTPNGDRKNGTFYGKSFGVTEYDIWIFDRWGLELWSCHNEGDNIPWDRYGEEGMSSACRWDGTYGGTRVEQDVYVWKVMLKDVYGKKHSYLGRVTVIY